MAKPIEIGFTAIRNHPLVRNLKSTERGIYVALVQVCLLDGVDPLPEGHKELARLAGASQAHWNAAGAVALKAVLGTIEKLRLWYQDTLQKQANMKLHGQRIVANLHGGAIPRGRLKKVSLEVKTHNFAPSSAAPVILQPTKAPPYRPQDIDMAARQNALLVKNDKANAKRLTDKR